MEYVENGIGIQKIKYPVKQRIDVDRDQINFISFFFYKDTHKYITPTVGLKFVKECVHDTNNQKYAVEKYPVV